MSSGKYYVVWVGRSTGIFTSWDECKKQVARYDGAKYRSFKTEEEAREAFGHKPPVHFAAEKKTTGTVNRESPSSTNPIANSLSVDAACSKNPGNMEYQGVHVATREVWFHKKFDLGTNNIGEFLAIVHGLAELNRRKINIPVYTDSITALSWVKKKKCGTKLPLTENTRELLELVKRAECWLINNHFTQPLLKWETKAWGEIPADFGRK